MLAVMTCYDYNDCLLVHTYTELVCQLVRYIAFRNHARLFFTDPYRCLSSRTATCSLRKDPADNVTWFKCKDTHARLAGRHWVTDR